MGRKLRWTVSVLVAVGAAAVTLGTTQGWDVYPKAWRVIAGPRARPLSQRTFERTPARLERGRYLAEGPLGCFRCHSERSWEEDGAPPVTGKVGAGRVVRPGLVAPNITPDKETGAGNWTDDMLARAIREGIGHDGRALHPQMWYRSFERLSDEDAASVVVYLRSVAPVKNPLPRTQSSLSERFNINSIPQPITTPVAEPDGSDSVKRGAYLEYISDCAGCHTSWYFPEASVHEQYFGGGNLIEEAGHKVMSANITFDPSGIAYYDEELFIRVMRTGKVGARQLHPIMPWYWYRNLSDEDLKALFAFLKAEKPVKHLVDNTEPPTYCARCQQEHGGGDRNTLP